MDCNNGLAGNRWQRAQRCWCIYLWDQAVTGDGPGTGVRQWGSCYGMGEAGRPGVDRRALCVPRAAAAPASRVHCTFHRHYVCLSVPTQNGRDGLVGWGGAPNLPCPISWSQSRTPVNDAHPWKLYMPLAVDVKALVDIDTASRCVLPRPCWF